MKINFAITPKHEGMKVWYMGEPYRLTGQCIDGIPELIDAKGNRCTRLLSELELDNVQLLPVGTKVICNGTIDVIEKHVQPGTENYAQGYRYILKEHGTQSPESVKEYNPDNVHSNGDVLTAFAMGYNMGQRNFQKDPVIHNADQVLVLAERYLLDVNSNPDNVQSEFVKYEAKGKQVWIDFKNQSGAGHYAIAACYTNEIANEIANALNQTKKKLNNSH
jgi:hypothetical protein